MEILIFSVVLIGFIAIGYSMINTLIESSKIDLSSDSYEKYENMNRRQLLNSLISAEKKSNDLQEKVKDNNNLILFLKSKLKASLDAKSYEPNGQTIKAMKENSGKFYNSYADFKQEIDQELSNEA